MPYRDERCVFIAKSLSEAETTVAFLGGHGIEAKVMDANAFGMLDGIAALAGSSARGLEVWVEPARLQEAGRLLAENTADIMERTRQGKASGPIEVVCEKCGKKTTFPGEDFGTIAECPRCGAYLDLGPAADWADEAETALYDPDEEGTEDTAEEPPGEVVDEADESGERKGDS